MPDVVVPRELTDTLETSSTDDRSDINPTQGLPNHTSEFEDMKAMTLDFPKLIASSPTPSPEPDEPNVETNTAETKTEHLVVTNEDDDAKPQRVRRCSSLKTGKTPPGKLISVYNSTTEIKSFL